MYLFQVSGWLEYENEEHNGADVLKSQQTAISDMETSCLSLQIKPLNRELHWRSHYPDGWPTIHRGGGAALTLICEQVLVKLPFLPRTRWICGWGGGRLHLSTCWPRSGTLPRMRRGENRACRSHEHLPPSFRLCCFGINSGRCLCADRMRETAGRGSHELPGVQWRKSPKSCRVALGDVYVCVGYREFRVIIVWYIFSLFSHSWGKVYVCWNVQISGI